MTELKQESENAPVCTSTPSPTQEPDFTSLGLPDPVMAGIREAGFTEMTPIQRKALPVALSGGDLCAQAQTGTGKTATFLISLFTRLLSEKAGDQKDPRPRALVLAPTRELALQILREADLLGVHTGLSFLAIYGGEGFARQEKGLRQGCDVVVGTPGRLLDFARRRLLKLDRIRHLVIDEADRLLDLGFWDELRDILRRLPPPQDRQSMLFSATLDSATRKIAREHMNRPTDLAVRPDQVAADGIDQTIYHVDRDEKFPLLLGILGRESVPKGLIFTNMKITAAWLVEKLKAHGYDRVGLLTGDLRQSMRNRVLERFKAGEIPLLVASDVASRGLHIDDVTHIINYDVPQDPEDYVHRIGRTARAGKQGKAYTLACDQYCYSLPEIETLMGFPLPYKVPGDEDYGVDRFPDLTVRKLLAQQRKAKAQTPSSRRIDRKPSRPARSVGKARGGEGGPSTSERKRSVRPRRSKGGGGQQSGSQGR